MVLVVAPSFSWVKVSAVRWVLESTCDCFE